jgi:hypothetical protein
VEHLYGADQATILPGDVAEALPALLLAQLTPLPALQEAAGLPNQLLPFGSIGGGGASDG